jgi:hypothetical protein
MSQPTNDEQNGDDLQAIVAEANQRAHLILVALRTIHEYVAPRAESLGIKLSARERHAWSVSLSIALSQSKAHLRLPATRFTKAQALPKKPIARPKLELFPRTEEPPVLLKLRQMMRTADATEAEVMAIVRESGVRESTLAEHLTELPIRTLELLVERWPTVLELIELARADAKGGGEAA